MRLALFGDPIAHSLSPAIHEAALAAAGIPGSYEARRVDAAALSHAVDELRAGTLDGANVTMPHKRSAAAACDELGPNAARAGAVNTLVRVGDTIVGHNTDVAGVRTAWREAGLPAEGPILVLGAGGAAAAALLALEGRPLSISARKAGAGAALASVVGVSATEVAWGESVDGAAIVNATPLGMEGEPLPEAVVAGGEALFDMTYGSDPGPAVTAYRRRGAPVADGEDMLIAQAAESFRLWTGRAADTNAMRAAAARARGEIRSAADTAT